MESQGDGVDTGGLVSKEGAGAQEGRVAARGLDAVQEVLVEGLGVGEDRDEVSVAKAQGSTGLEE
jgi:hypothetical protein